MKLTRKQQRELAEDMAMLPGPGADCRPTGGSHMLTDKGAIRCHCERGRKLVEIDRKYRPYLRAASAPIEQEDGRRRATGDAE
ncbi:MAG: hypothetical protein KGL39_55605 [Patescibacteria group bacterium]|nr:hypothetical protein [Patescibacteria group bacterium]